MKKMLLLSFLVITGVYVSAQHPGKDGFSFYSATSTKNGEDVKDEYSIFNLSVPDKIFVHNDMMVQIEPVAQIYRVKSYEVVTVSKHDWYADFVVVSNSGTTYQGRLTIEGDSEVLLIGETLFVGIKSTIKPYEKSVKK